MEERDISLLLLVRVCISISQGVGTSPHTQAYAEENRVKGVFCAACKSGVEVKTADWLKLKPGRHSVVGRDAGGAGGGVGVLEDAVILRARSRRSRLPLRLDDTTDDSLLAPRVDTVGRTAQSERSR